MNSGANISKYKLAGSKELAETSDAKKKKKKKKNDAILEGASQDKKSFVDKHLRMRVTGSVQEILDASKVNTSTYKKYIHLSQAHAVSCVVKSAIIVRFEGNYVGIIADVTSGGNLSMVFIWMNFGSSILE